MLNQNKIHWRAIYTDGTYLNQYNDDGTENLFKDIDQSKLFEFALFYNDKVLSVFMPSGTFGINGFLHNTEVSFIKNQDYRLIYFVRHCKTLGPEGKEKDIYNVGFQTTVNGVNYKKIISIDNNQLNFNF